MKNAGKYRHQIVLQTITETSDGVGGYTESAATLATVWAAVYPMQGRRLMDYRQLINGQWYDIEIKYREDITFKVGDTITFGTKILTTHTMINENESDEVYKITAYEKA